MTLGLKHFPTMKQVDYRIRGEMQQQQVKDVNELKQRMSDVTYSNDATKEWCRHLRECIRVKEAHLSI